MLCYNVLHSAAKGLSLSFLVESFSGAAMAVAGGEPTVLFRALSPGVRLAIWQRRLPGNWRGATAPLLAAAPFRAVAEDEPERAVDRLVAQLPPCPALLLHDLRLLAGLFAVLSVQPRVRLRLEAMTGVACPRWHADAVPLRLLCTYRGPGTEWLPADETDAPPNRIGAPCAALLKGRGFPGAGADACLHRSPALAPRQARLLLCIDLPGHFPGGA